MKLKYLVVIILIHYSYNLKIKQSNETNYESPEISK